MILTLMVVRIRFQEFKMTELTDWSTNKHSLDSIGLDLIFIYLNTDREFNTTQIENLTNRFKIIIPIQDQPMCLGLRSS